MNNLLHWRLMLAVAELGTLSRAAEQCGITQSGASQAIAQMEAGLGVPLFVREVRTMTLTAVGQQVLEKARRMLAEWQDIRLLAQQAEGIQPAQLLLASFPSVYSEKLQHFVRHFRHQYPAIEVVNLTGTDVEARQWLEQGQVDLAVLMNAPVTAPGLLLGADQWVAVLASQHPLANRSSQLPLSLAELAAMPFIVATGGCDLHSEVLFQALGQPLQQVVMRVQEWSTAYALLRQNRGVSVVPASTLPADQSGLRVFPLATACQRTFVLQCSPHSSQTIATQRFLDSLQAWLSNGV